MKNSFLRLGVISALIVTTMSCQPDEDLQEFDTIKSEQNSENKDLSATGTVNSAKESILKTYWMRKDHEPNSRGSAEIYAFIIGLDSDKDPIIKRVPMYYADHDKTVYYPNQSFINWSNFYYNKVNIVFIEADDTHFGEDPQWSNSFEDGYFKNVPVEFALRYVTNQFRYLGLISSSDDWVDNFENISRYSNYNVVGGKRDNVYITLEREY